MTNTNTNLSIQPNMLFNQIRKRDGSIVNFDANKISFAIARAGAASNEFSYDLANELTVKVLSLLESNPIQEIEHIQDTVEKVLWEAGFFRTARSYIVYREQHARLRIDSKIQIDVISSIDEYLNKADWRVNANANQGYSLGGLILNSAGKMIANYWLSHAYPPEIGDAHREADIHIHDLDFLAGYCAGWSLRMLLQEGLNGVPGKIEAAPPKHMSSAIGQIVNFLGTLQNEWAGAQAFSSFDTYMAPYVRIDKLDYLQIKQNIQELIYNLNVPSRWGCVTPDTEILTINGWKNYKDVASGEKIYGFVDGTIILDEILAINEYQYNGKMASLRSRDTDQLLTPNHRVARYGHDDKNEQLIVETAEIVCEAKTPTNVPVAGITNNPEYPIEDDMLRLFAWIIADGTIPLPNRKEICSLIQKYKLPMHILRQCSARQIRLFIDTYRKGDGEKDIFIISSKDIDIINNLQELAVLAGLGTSIDERVSTISGNKLFYITFLTKGNGSISITKKEWIDYEGTVWCPTTTSTFWVARRNRTVFITGNSQSPFTNLTFDWVCPEDLKTQVPLIGGKEVDFTYGDLQHEMDLINKSYIEVMTEGDHKGRIFTFPIPTYNITNDFPWDSENANLLFNMTAKFGLPYFQNFISSELKPNMVRSMCLFPEEKILFKEHERISNTTIGNLFIEYTSRQLDSEWWECISNISALSLNSHTGKFEWAKITKFLRITDNRLVSIKTKDGKLMRLSPNHLVAVLTRQGIETKKADEVNIDDFVLVVKNASAALNQDAISEEDIKLAWFIGLFIADGNYLYDNHYELQRLRGVQISFNLQDVDLINTCRDFVKQRLNYEMKFVKDRRYKNSLYGYIYNTQFANFLFIEKGVRKYGGIPNWLWNSNVEAIKSFLSGFFDGDGYKSGQEIHINDTTLAIELNLLLQIVGISTTYVTKKHSQVIRIQHTLGRGSKGTKIKCDKSHNSIPQFLLDKFDVTNAEGVRYHCYGKKMVGLSAIYRWGLTNDKIECLRHSDFAVVAVRSVHIENLDYQQEFYDIELEKNHYFVHSDGNISHNCCRLQLDLRELLKRGNGLFGSSEQTGSIGVVTINCARLGYLFKANITGLYERLDHLLELAKNSLEIKRKVIQRHIDAGLFPYTKRYLGTLRNHFSTIGVNGINEMIRNFTNDNEDITTSNGHEMAARFLDHIRAKMIEFQEATGHMYNLEATPAEGTTYRFAKEDQKRYNGILQAGTKDAPYYTNSSQLPVGYTTDAFQALEMQEDLQSKYTGGTVLHLYMGERISNAESCKKLIKRALERFRVPYLTISPTFSICPIHGYINGEHKFCPMCDETNLIKECIDNAC